MLTEIWKQNALSFICKEWFFVVTNILYTIKYSDGRGKGEQNENKNKKKNNKNSEMLIITYIFFKTNCSHLKHKQYRRKGEKCREQRKEE